MNDADSILPLEIVSEPTSLCASRSRYWLSVNIERADFYQTVPVVRHNDLVYQHVAVNRTTVHIEKRALDGISVFVKGP